MKRKTPLAEARSDLEDVSVSVNGASFSDTLTREILEERRNRLRKQNVKLDFDIHKQTQEYGDISELKRQVLRCNMVVKQSFFGMASRIASQLVLMTDEAEIQQFLLAQFTQAFNDLAYEHGRATSPDS